MESGYGKPGISLNAFTHEICNWTWCFNGKSQKYNFPKETQTNLIKPRRILRLKQNNNAPTIQKRSTHPFVILVQAFEEMFHPVAKRLESRWSQLAPNVRNLTVEQRTRNFVQFTTHSHFTCKGLRKKQYCGKYVMHQETPITPRIKMQMCKLTINYRNCIRTFTDKGRRTGRFHSCAGQHLRTYANFCSKRKRLHKKRFQISQDWFN